MKIVVTGDSAQIARLAIAQLESLGHVIHKMSNLSNWRLGNRIEETCDLLLHFAHDRDHQSANILGTRLLSEHFGQKVIYISTIATQGDLLSIYVINKKECEDIVKLYGGRVLRLGIFPYSELPGLVMELDKKSRAVPPLILPELKGVNLWITTIEEFIKSLLLLIEQEDLLEFNAVEPFPVTLRMLVSRLIVKKRLLRRTTIFLPNFVLRLFLLILPNKIKSRNKSIQGVLTLMSNPTKLRES